MIRSRTWLLVVAAIALAWILVSPNNATSGDQPAQYQLPMPGYDPCQPLMAAITVPGAPDLIKANGLPERAPAALFAEFEIASWTCLGERVSGTVQGAMLRFRDAKGDLAGAVVLLPRSGGEAEDWVAYLGQTLEQSLNVVETPYGYVGGAKSQSGQRLLVVARDGGPSSSVWAALLSRAADISANDGL